MRSSSLLQRLIGFMLAVALGVLAFIWASGAAADVPAQPGAVTPAPAPAQPAPAPTAQAGAPVTVDGKVIFRVRERIGAFTPSERADAISKRINELATNPFLPADYVAPGFRFSPGNLAPADRSVPKDGA